MQEDTNGQLGNEVIPVKKKPTARKFASLFTNNLHYYFLACLRF